MKCLAIANSLSGILGNMQINGFIRMPFLKRETRAANQWTSLIYSVFVILIYKGIMYLPLYIVGGHVMFMASKTINWKFLSKNIKPYSLKITIMFIGCLNYGCIEFSILMIVFEMLRISENMNRAAFEVIIEYEVLDNLKSKLELKHRL
jgi:MFS superfamily sulfate permease-like transporter